MKVYLDTSALNRIFDDQSQARIYLESVSMEVIFLLIENKIIDIVSSDALVFETNNNPYSDRRAFIEKVLEKATSFQSLNQEILTRSEEMETSMKIKGVDALHLACAEALKVDDFITSDDKLIKRYRGVLAVKNPTEFANNVTLEQKEEEEND